MIKKISVTANDVFIPEWDGNRDLDPVDQIRVKYRNPTVTMKERLIPRSLNMAPDDNGKMQPSMRVVIDRRKVIEELTISIDGCGYEIDEKQKPIATIEQLFSAPVDFDPFIEELYTFYQSLLIQKVDEKN